MQINQFFKATVLALILVIGFVVCWEWYWRLRGFTVAYNDDKVLWATQRKNVYKSSDQATVFIGSSRSRFDLDIETWKKETGEEGIQLAFGGTSPRPILHDLARDEKFKGKVIIDVAEQLFFSVDSMRGEKSAQDALEYFRHETPAQKVSASINYVLESKLVFLEEGKFGLNALLSDIEIDRPGVFVRPFFPREFSQLSFERQSKFTPMFLASPQLQKEQFEARAKILAANKVVPIKGKTLEAFLKEIKTSIDRIIARGGVVIFLRPPSNGPSLERENKLYPRKEYWDRLLEYTKIPGYYFADYPETAHFICVDESHLSPSDAVVYTRQLIEILKREKTLPLRTIMK